MPLELADLREKATLSDPAVFAMEAKKVENLAKKHKVKADALKTEAYTTEFKRCGNSYSKRLHSLVVGNNAVRMLSFEAPLKKKNRIHAIFTNKKLFPTPLSILQSAITITTS